MIWTIIQLVISGIAMGFVYALIGIEYTLIYNASGVLNFSHDKMVSLGAYIYAGMFVLGLGWNSMVSAIASLLLMAVFGILVAYLIFIPLRKQKSMIFTIMATIMFGKVIMEGACLIWGGNAFTIPGLHVRHLRSAMPLSQNQPVSHHPPRSSSLHCCSSTCEDQARQGHALRGAEPRRPRSSASTSTAIWRSPSPSVP